MTIKPTESAISGAASISVRGLGKRYGLANHRRASTIVDRVGRMTRGQDRNPFTDASVWALRDLSFDVPKGEVMAVIGRNGSGKTTLMRILARVTAPTEGSARIHGRVGALFQVGTGFHNELTGRENIGLSGAILGMDERRLAEVFDEIVDFADIGEFLDTPVKFYSSGMSMRLAFSVSAHLDAEVMLIDEALSVGDASFSKKSSDLIRDLVRSGRTVIYVSHNQQAVKDMCDSAIVLEQGQLRFGGGVEEALEFYDELLKETVQQPLQVPVRVEN